jgi:sigma-E factor negative regulatory protein RseA
MSFQDEDLKQKVSALIDEELDSSHAHGVIDRLVADEELKALWGRYGLIGQAIRAPSGPLAHSSFAERVSEAVRDEPVVLAPRLRRRDQNNLRHQFVSFALAASLAGVAVIMGRSLVENAGLPPAAVEQVAAQGEKGDSPENVAQAQFDDYLLMHNETASMAGSAGMLPYVRLVSHQSDR